MVPTFWLSTLVAAAADKMMMFLVVVLLELLAVIVSQPIGNVPGSSRSFLSSSRGAVHYAIEEELAIGTSVGHGIGTDSGFIDRLKAADDEAAIANLRFRFLTQAPIYLEIDEMNGVLRTKARVDREEICSSDNEGQVMTGSDNSCQMRIDIAVQPMQYFQIFKVIILINCQFNYLDFSLKLKTFFID